LVLHERFFVMAQIPTYDQWMRDTSSLTSPRSQFLKAVDQALRTFNMSPSTDNRGLLSKALDRWRFEQSKQGKDWKQSVRNQKGAVTNLYRALADVDKRKLSLEEIEAMKYISHAQSMALAKMFDSKQLRFKSNTVVGTFQGASGKWDTFKNGVASVKTVGSTAHTVYSSVDKIKTGADLLHKGGKAAVMGASKTAMAKNFSDIESKIREFCKELCPGIDPNHVFTALHLGGVEHFAANLAPFVGVISSGGKAVLGWVSVARKAYSMYDLKGYADAFAPKDPSAAFDAVLVLVKRELHSQIAKASVATTAFSGKALGVWADAGAVTGPVIGLLELLAEIFQTIVEYVRDYKECQAANEALRVGALNLDLFTVSPVLGCYFLVVQDHSTIINFAVGDYGTPNWMFDVEQLVLKINDVLEKCRDLIRESRLEIPDMKNVKGLVEQNYSVKTGFSKVTGAPGAVKDKITDTVSGWFMSPTRPPKPVFDKARIQGFGYTPPRI